MSLLTIFLDASVILSGLASPTGGSGKVLDAGKLRRFTLLTSQLVLEEVTNHLQKLDIKPDQLETLFSGKAVHLIASPSEEMIKKFRKSTPDPHDAHVLAGAGLSGAKILLSLDKQHILIPRVRNTLKPMLVLSPKDFWGSRNQT